MANGKTTKPQDNAALAATREEEKLALALENISRIMLKSSADLKITKWIAIIGFSAYVVFLIVCLYFLLVAFLQY